MKETKTQTIEDNWNNIQYIPVYPWQVWDLIKEGKVVYALNKFYKKVETLNAITAGDLAAILDHAEKHKNEYEIWYEVTEENNETV